MRTVAVIVAAPGDSLPPGSASGTDTLPPGSASRADSVHPRSSARAPQAAPLWLLPLAGRRVAEHSVAVFTGVAAINEVILALPPGYATALYPRRRPARLRLIEGSTTRMETVWRVICALDEEKALGQPDEAGESRLLIHDANRPLITAPVVEACAAALCRYPAAGATIPSPDTVMAVDGDVIADIPSRDRLHRRQTPQGFRLPVIRKAYERARADPHCPKTDDCGLVLHYLPGVAVAAVPGSANNIKITRREDLAVAEALLAGHAATG